MCKIQLFVNFIRNLDFFRGSAKDLLVYICYFTQSSENFNLTSKSLVDPRKKIEISYEIDKKVNLAHNMPQL